MLFVALLKPKAGTPQERIARRLNWQYPAGVRQVAEYWLQTSNPDVVGVFEADSIAPIMAITTNGEMCSTSPSFRLLRPKRGLS